MFNHQFTLKSAALLALASISLVACSQPSANTPLSETKPQTKQTNSKTVGTDRNQTNKSLETKSSSVASTQPSLSRTGTPEASTEVADKTPVAETLPAESSTMPASSTQTVTDEIAQLPIEVIASQQDQSPTIEQTEQLPSPESIVVEDTRTSETLPPVVTDTFTENDTTVADQSIVVQISPGPVAGTWATATGRLWSMTENGTSPDGSLYLSSLSSDANGIIALSAHDSLTGFGAYIHYYPAGIPLMVTILRQDEHGNWVETQTLDPTDSSRDRLIMGNGSYISMAEEQLNDFIANVFYRQ